jgi:organic anion transporter 4A
LFSILDTKRIRAEKVSEAHSKHQYSEAVVNKDFGQTAKDFPKSFRILLSNPTFMFLNLAGATEGIL